MSLDEFILSSDPADFNYPEIRPTLNLNFAKAKTLDPRITFTRSSGGSYIGADGIIKYAGVNEPRFDHDPLTRESLGLLIEDTRTNLMFPSNIANTISSGGDQVTLTIDTTVANPFGGFDGVLKCVHKLSGGQFFRRGQTLSLTGGIPYTFTFYFKNGDERYNPFNQNAINSIGILAIGTVTKSLDKNIPVGNGWYKQVLNFTPLFSDSYDVNFIMNVTVTPIYTFYLYGFQVEAGAYPSSYIPTTSAARTRAADNVSISGSNFNNFYKQGEGTFYVSFRKPNFPTIATASSGIFAVDDGTGNNSLGLTFFEIQNRIKFENIKSGVTAPTIEPSIAMSVPNTLTKVSCAYKTNNFSLSSNIDNKIISNYSGFVPNVNTLRIGASKTGSERLNGTISNLSYFAKRLPDPQLESYTT